VITLKKLLNLYWIFFKMGIVNFGGGYALLPLLQKELVEKRCWATNEEITDYYAIGQCTPGAIAVNVSTFIGYKIKGVLGGILATLGFISPAFIIIFVIATVLNQFADYWFVQSAFKAIRATVFILVLSAVIKLSKKSVVDWITLIIALVVLGLTIFTEIPLFVYVLIAGFIGVMVNWYKEKKKLKVESVVESNLDDEVKTDEASESEAE
jgi:chromate transporter